MKHLICISDICPLAGECSINLQNEKQDKRKFVYTDFYYLVYRSHNGWQCQQQRKGDEKW